jgi:hypothetical protein
MERDDMVNEIRHIRDNLKTANQVLLRIEKELAEGDE